MKRTEILCPECFKKKLMSENKKDEQEVYPVRAWCDECGTEFINISKNTVRYK